MLKIIKNKIMNLIYYIFSLFPIQKKILLQSNPDFSDNTFEIYKSLILKNIDKEYELIWVVTEKNNLKLPEYNTILYKSIKCYLYSFTAAYTLYSHRFLGNPKNKKQRRVFLVHGFSLKKTKGLFWDETYNTDIICLSDFHKEKREYTMPKAGNRSIITGFPRNDILFFKNKEVLNVFNVKDDEKLIVWLPTFRHMDKHLGDRCDIDGSKKEFELLTDETLMGIDNFLKSHKCKLIVKYHPCQDPMLVSHGKNYDNILTLLSDEFLNYHINLYALLSVTDALISDFSSVYIDFLLLNRPIAFDISDIDSYKKGLGFLVDSPEQYMPGHFILNKLDLENFINDVYTKNDKYQNQREKKAKELHKYLDGNSTKRVLDMIGLGC